MGYKEIDVYTYPLPDEPPLFILKSMPCGVPIPQEFETGSYNILQDVLRGVDTYFKEHLPYVVTEWTNWARDVAPHSDLVSEYEKHHPLQIPLKDSLFLQQLSNTELATNLHLTGTSDSLQQTNVRYRSMPSVQCSSQGRLATQVCIFVN
jgi:hypothetical protein